MYVCMYVYRQIALWYDSILGALHLDSDFVCNNVPTV